MNRMDYYKILRRVNLHNEPPDGSDGGPFTINRQKTGSFRLKRALYR